MEIVWNKTRGKKILFYSLNDQKILYINNIFDSFLCTTDNQIANDKCFATFTLNSIYKMMILLNALETY